MMRQLVKLDCFLSCYCTATGHPEISHGRTVSVYCPVVQLQDILKPGMDRLLTDTNNNKK